MIGNYSEERRKAIEEIEAKIGWNLTLLRDNKAEVRKRKELIRKLESENDIYFEKLLELDPCLMR
jgi:hypothetical protein